MNIQKLRIYIALANSAHFGRAATQCHVSPSTVSRNLKQLEAEVGQSLMLRDNRSVTLTAAGAHFLRFARESVQQWETFHESLASETQTLTGQLSIYCSVTASYSFLYDILTAFRERQSGIAIKLHTGDPAQAIERVVQGYEDIAIAAKPDKLPNGLSFNTISRSALVFILPASASLNDKSQWQSLPMIISEEGLARDRLNRWSREQRITPEIYAEVKGNEAIVSMVSLGFGVGLVPKIVLDNSPLREQVILAPNQPDLGPFETGFCVLDKRLKSPIVSALWQLI